MTIYTEFMFKKFIFRFRRFFDFYKDREYIRKDEPDRSLKKTRLIEIFQRAVNKVKENNLKSNKFFMLSKVINDKV
jgi:hypothetical protein